jgi:hypothetical protein
MEVEVEEVEGEEAEGEEEEGEEAVKGEEAAVEEGTQSTLAAAGGASEAAVAAMEDDAVMEAAQGLLREEAAAAAARDVASEELASNVAAVSEGMQMAFEHGSVEALAVAVAAAACQAAMAIDGAQAAPAAAEAAPLTAEAAPAAPVPAPPEPLEGAPEGANGPLSSQLPAWYSPERFAEMLQIAGMRPTAINDRLFRRDETAITQFGYPGVSFQEWKRLEGLRGVGLDAQAADKSSALVRHFKLVSSREGHDKNELARAFAQQVPDKRPSRGKRGRE